ncbi:hypothetical protein RFI_10211, partial [Reticulomyxa filosa]
MGQVCGRPAPSVLDVNTIRGHRKGYTTVPDKEGSVTGLKSENYNKAKNESNKHNFGRKKKIEQNKEVKNGEVTKTIDTDTIETITEENKNIVNNNLLNKEEVNAIGESEEYIESEDEQEKLPDTTSFIDGISASSTYIAWKLKLLKQQNEQSGDKETPSTDKHKKTGTTQSESAPLWEQIFKLSKMDTFEDKEDLLQDFMDHLVCCEESNRRVMWILYFQRGLMELLLNTWLEALNVCEESSREIEPAWSSRRTIKEDKEMDLIDNISGNNGNGNDNNKENGKMRDEPLTRAQAEVYVSATKVISVVMGVISTMADSRELEKAIADTNNKPVVELIKRTLEIASVPSFSFLSSLASPQSPESPLLARVEDDNASDAVAAAAAAATETVEDSVIIVDDALELVATLLRTTARKYGEQLAKENIHQSLLKCMENHITHVRITYQCREVMKLVIKQASRNYLVTMFHDPIWNDMYEHIIQYLQTQCQNSRDNANINPSNDLTDGNHNHTSANADFDTSSTQVPLILSQHIGDPAYRSHHYGQRNGDHNANEKDWAKKGDRTRFASARSSFLFRRYRGFGRADSVDHSDANRVNALQKMIRANKSTAMASSTTQQARQSIDQSLTMI